MNKRLLFNGTVVVIAILIIVAILWAKQNYAPKKLLNVRKETPPPTATPRPTPKPTPIPTPITIKTLSADQLKQLKTYLAMAAEHKNVIQNEMLPPVERLFKRGEAEILKWADDASWPISQYNEKLKEFDANRAYFRPMMPAEYAQLEESILEAEKTFMEGTGKFEHSPRGPMEYPPDILAKLKEQSLKIDQTMGKLEDRKSVV